MALESPVNYINDLVITNPTGSDPVSAGDDHIRNLKTALKECLNGFAGGILLRATESGTAAAHVLNPATALVTYATGQMLLYSPTNANSSGAVTVNVSSLGAKSIKTALGADPTANDIIANQPLLLVYDGTNFVILAGSATLMRTGNQTLTGNLTVTGNITQTGNLAITGDASVSGSLTGPSMTAKANKAGETYSGTHDFASATITAPTKTAGTSTTDVATCAFVVAQAFSAILPGQTGNAGKVLGTDGSNASWVSAGPQVSNKTADYTILTTDLGKVITLTGATSRTFTTPAAATAGAGWYCYVHNNCNDTAAASNPVTMTIDGNASETIDAVTTVTEYKNGALLLMTDGSNWFTVRISGGFARFVQTGTFTWPTKLTHAMVDVIGGGGGGGKTPIGANSAINSGGGGGRRFMPIPFLTVNTSTTATVGAAGVGSTTTGANGTSGGQSSFSSIKAGGGGSSSGGGGIDTATGASGGLPNINTMGAAVLGNVGYGGAGSSSGNAGGNAEFGGGGGGSPGAGGPNGYAGGSSINGGGGGGGGGGNGVNPDAGTGGAGGSNNSTTTGGGGAGGTTAPTAGTSGTSRDFAAGDGGGGGGSSGTAGAAGGDGGVPGGGGGAGGAGSVSTGNGGNGGRGEIRIWYR